MAISSTAAMRPLVTCLLIVGAALATPVQARAADIHVAVAANFLGTLQKLAPMYQRASGNQLVLSAGSSGQLYTLIRQGAPFDVLLSADSDRPARLESEGLAVPGSRFTYATGTLVLWSARPGLVDPAGRVLSKGRFRMLAIANPATAPYGAAARRVLMALGIWDQLNRRNKIAVGENVDQAWQFVATGAAELGFVALSQISRGGLIAGSYWIAPQSMYPPIDQDAVLLTRGSERRAAESFLRWLRYDPHAIAIIRAAGYQLAR